MQEVVQSIYDTTGGKIDLLVATHEHWDHLSGFLQARELFGKFQIERVWLPWTEDPNDALASSLRKENEALRVALTCAAARMRFAGDADPTIDEFLSLFGPAGQGTTGEALQAVKGLSPNLRFCRPEDQPTTFDGVPARFYILGPPHDEKMIKRYNPSKAQQETYGVGKLPLDTIAPALSDVDVNAPFDPIVQIPLEAGKADAFLSETLLEWRFGGSILAPHRFRLAGLVGGFGFAVGQRHQQHEPGACRGTGRRPRDAVCGRCAGGQLALLAGPSLEDRRYGGYRTGLLRRTIFYKVGHHGSHNATLQDKGLEEMKTLEVAMIPVDRTMALKKGWGRIPLEELEKRLEEKTNGRVLRADKAVPEALADRVPANTLYYEISILP